MMANWVFASHHSRGGIFHFPATWRKTRYNNFIAASSVGKWPLVLTAPRRFAFNDSIAFVTGMKIGGAFLSGWNPGGSSVWYDPPG
jgi:hypothetical protein